MSTPMSEKEIKANAPDGATHYDIHGDYWKVDGDLAHFMWQGDNKWIKHEFNNIQAHISRGVVKPL